MQGVKYVIYFGQGCRFVGAIQKRLQQDVGGGMFYFQDVRDLDTQPAWLSKLPTLVDVSNKKYCAGVECLFFVENAIRENEQSAKTPPQGVSIDRDNGEDSDLAFGGGEDYTSGEFQGKRMGEADLLAKIRERFGN